MASLQNLDSPNRAVRAIERWKRGLGVAALVFLGALPGAVAAALAMTATELAGGESYTALAGWIAFLVFAPWGLGQRHLLRQIGEMAKVATEG